MPDLVRSLTIALVVLFASCSNVEEKRIRQLLNEKGFGTRAQGVATVENYVTGGDALVFYLDPTMVVQPGYEQLALLTRPQRIGLDGTIHVPYIGNVHVLGMTEREVESLVKELLEGLYNTPIPLTARIADGGKAIYAFGEVEKKGRLPMVKGDITILEALATLGWTRLANLGRVQLIRPDAENPLVMEVNFREIVLTGNTTYNVVLQDNDILYVPPTFFGLLTRFIQKLLEPLSAVVRSLYGVAVTQSTWEILTNNNRSLNGNRRYFFNF